MVRPETSGSLRFGEPEAVDGSLSRCVRGLVGSEILKIAGDIRELAKSGRSVCNLTVGDFDPRQFPIPVGLADRVRQAYADGETNYPPSDGMTSLRAGSNNTSSKVMPSYLISSCMAARSRKSAKGKPVLCRFAGGS